MNNYWFTSDQHFNHSRIIQYCHRPFLSVEEMNETIIENFNKVVKSKDEVYHLGDFCFDKNDMKYFLNRLNGSHKLILGNHDPKQFDKTLFEWVKDTKMIQVNNQNIFMSHYAHRVWPQSHYGSWHLYGHSHNTLLDYGRSTDIGVDAWGFSPVSFDQLKEFFKDVVPTYDM